MSCFEIRDKIKTRFLISQNNTKVKIFKIIDLEKVKICIFVNLDGKKITHICYIRALQTYYLINKDIYINKFRNNNTLNKINNVKNFI